MVGIETDPKKIKRKPQTEIIGEFSSEDIVGYGAHDIPEEEPAVENVGDGTHDIQAEEPTVEEQNVGDGDHDIPEEEPAVENVGDSSNDIEAEEPTVEEQNQKYALELHAIEIGSDYKGRWDAKVSNEVSRIPVPQKTQKGLEDRANNVRTYNELAQDMEEKSVDPLSDRNSANVSKSSQGKDDKSAKLEWNNVVKMPDGSFEVYPPNPDGKNDNNAKWVITPEQVAKHHIGEDGLDLTTKSSEELNEIVGLSKENVRNHGIEAEKGNRVQSMQQGQDGRDIGDR